MIFNRSVHVLLFKFRCTYPFPPKISIAQKRSGNLVFSWFPFVLWTLLDFFFKLIIFLFQILGMTIHFLKDQIYVLSWAFRALCFRLILPNRWNSQRAAQSSVGSWVNKGGKKGECRFLGPITPSLFSKHPLFSCLGHTHLYHHKPDETQPCLLCTWSNSWALFKNIKQLYWLSLFKSSPQISYGHPTKMAELPASLVPSLSHNLSWHLFFLIS